MTRATATDIRRTTTAGATSQTYEQLVRHAHVILSACGRSMSANKVCKLTHRYEQFVQRNGWTFFDYITNEMLLTEQEQAAIWADPDAYNSLRYLDPTGDCAVRNVMRQRGF
jgi:hypothetical protein